MIAHTTHLVPLLISASYITITGNAWNGVYHTWQNIGGVKYW